MHKRLLTLSLIMAACSRPTEVDVVKLSRRYATDVVALNISVNQTVGTGVFIRVPSSNINEVAGSVKIDEQPEARVAILTNAHVCRVFDQLQTQALAVVDGLSLVPVRAVAQDADRDLCFMKLPRGYDHDAVRLKVRQPEFAQSLFIIGFPLGGPKTPASGRYLQDADIQLADGAEATPAGDWVCPAKARLELTLFGPLCIFTMNLSLTTVPTYPGNSGSPVFNGDAEFVGMINSSDSRTNLGNFIQGSEIETFINLNKKALR